MIAGKIVPTIKGNVLSTKEKHWERPAFFGETEFLSLGYVKN